MVDAEIDKTDRLILTELQRDGRAANTTLADRVNLSPSPCLRRVRDLESRGVITGYRAELDRQALGLGLTVFAELQVSGHSREIAESVEETVANIPEVVACHLISGAADFLLEIAVPDLAAYERLLLDSLLELPGVHELRSNITIRTVKAPAPLPLRHLGG